MPDEEGLPKVFARHDRLAAATRAAVTSRPRDAVTIRGRRARPDESISAGPCPAKKDVVTHHMFEAANSGDCCKLSKTPGASVMSESRLSPSVPSHAPFRGRGYSCRASPAAARPRPPGRLGARNRSEWRKGAKGGANPMKSPARATMCASPGKVCDAGQFSIAGLDYSPRQTGFSFAMKAATPVLKSALP